MIVNGIHLPDTEEHVVRYIEAGPIVHGKGTYQYRKYAAVRELVPGRRTAVDIGAHVGLWSRLMAHDFGRVVAFEPNPALHTHFTLNTEGLENVYAMHCALGAREGSTRLNVDDTASCLAHVAPDGVEVPVQKLDSFGLTGVDLIKIDVEGYEWEVLQGATQTIVRERPLIIIEQKPNNAERYGRKQHDAKDRLVKMGMRVLLEMDGDFILRWPDGKA